MRTNLVNRDVLDAALAEIAPSLTVEGQDAIIDARTALAEMPEHFWSYTAPPALAATVALYDGEV